MLLFRPLLCQGYSTQKSGLLDEEKGGAGDIFGLPFGSVNQTEGWVGSKGAPCFTTVFRQDFFGSLTVAMRFFQHLPMASYV